MIRFATAHGLFIHAKVGNGVQPICYNASTLLIPGATLTITGDSVF
jgi:hypothetical protein